MVKQNLLNVQCQCGGTFLASPPKCMCPQCGKVLMLVERKGKSEVDLNGRNRKSGVSKFGKPSVYS